MELSEIIEEAVAVASRKARQGQQSTKTPAKLATVSPEPVIASKETKPEPGQRPKSHDSAAPAAQSTTNNPPRATPYEQILPTRDPGAPGHAASAVPPVEPKPAPSVVPAVVPADVSGAAVEASGGSEDTAESPEAQQLNPFKALVRRSYIKNPPEPGYNPLDFYADVRFIPIMVSRGVFQVLQMSPALREPSLYQSHTLVSHGAFSHTWSLLPLGSSTARTNAVVRPIAVLQTYGKGIPLADAVINDYAYAWRAEAVHLRHYVDSWSVSGTHAAFQVCKDYVFEWKPIEFPRGSGTFEVYLWRHNIEEGSISPAARICRNSPVKSPIDDSELWSLEVDVDKLAPHIALLSAFSIKLPSAAIHSWFAPKEMSVPIPTPLVNFAFQDDGHVYQRLEKFYGDWEDSRIRHLQQAAASSTGDNGASISVSGVSQVSTVQVFKRDFIDQYAFPPEVIEMLNAEALAYLEAVKARYGIH